MKEIRNQVFLNLYKVKFLNCREIIMHFIKIMKFYNKENQS